MSVEQNVGPFMDGVAYENPFRVLEEHGKEWARLGMNVWELAAAAQQFGGDVQTDNARRALIGYSADLYQQNTPHDVFIPGLEYHNE